MNDDAPHQKTPPSNIAEELENYLTVLARIRPHNADEAVGSIDVFGETRYFSGAAGGDHIIYLNFERRYDLVRRSERALSDGHDKVASKLLENRDRIGVLLADVSGHRITDGLVAAMLHQAFLTGVLYELELFGEVTPKLFENLNTRFFKSTSIEKYITMIYGEISSSGTFRFISAGHPRPLVFSNEFDRLVEISDDRLTTFYPLGLFPSSADIDASRNLGALRYKPEYTVNEVNLMGTGDILLLYSDGLSEHSREDEDYVPDGLEKVLREAKGGSSQEIFNAIWCDMERFAPLEDDFSLVLIKRRR